MTFICNSGGLTVKTRAPVTLATSPCLQSGLCLIDGHKAQIKDMKGGEVSGYFLFAGRYQRQVLLVYLFGFPALAAWVLMLHFHSTEWKHLCSLTSQTVINVAYSYPSPEKT